MFSGIERLRNDHDTQFYVKRFAFISMPAWVLMDEGVVCAASL